MSERKYCKSVHLTILHHKTLKTIALNKGISVEQALESILETKFNPLELYVKLLEPQGEE